MITTSDLADTIGRRALADALGVTTAAVSNAVVRGSFPPSWYVTAKRLADAAGAACPPELFKMKASDNTQTVYSRTGIQVRGPYSERQS